MIVLADLFDLELLRRMLEEGYVRRQQHPTLPLQILNYTQRAAYDGVWNPVTLQCRGLIHRLEGPGEIVARPFPKFFNHGQEGAPVLDLEARAFVSEKLDGSLGILYPEPSAGHAVATRGSFTSEQAIHATEVYVERYEQDSLFEPAAGMTYLFEIVYPANRIVVDYAGLDDLVLLAIIDTATGEAAVEEEGAPGNWPGPSAEDHPYRSLAEALEAEPRPNCEGLVVYFPDTNQRVKVKQDDYMALHRILTGTNARNVWEVAAVHACAHLIREPKHWGSFLGVDPARAEQVLALGDEWLEGVPDEFHDWVRRVDADAMAAANEAYEYGCRLIPWARGIADRRERYEWVKGWAGSLTGEVMRVSTATSAEAVATALGQLLLRCWREACPEPTAPFARTEDVA